MPPSYRANTHTHTHTQRERERERERMLCNEISLRPDWNASPLVALEYKPFKLTICIPMVSGWNGSVYVSAA